MEVVLALTCLAVGAASYRGHFRWWATEFGYGWYAGFTFLYLGIILLIPASFSVFGSPLNLGEEFSLTFSLFAVSQLCSHFS